jgi:hypothetical protein
MPDNDSAHKRSNRTQIVVAIIGALGVILAAYIAASNRNSDTQPQPPTVSVSPPSAQPATAGASTFRVVETPIKIEPAQSAGSCPVTITATATILVEGGSGEVSYRWLLNGKDPTAEKTITFGTNATQTVSTTWTIEASDVSKAEGKPYIQIEILKPDRRFSKQFPIDIEC